MSKKSAQSISVIGGADGPTSVFLAGRKNRKLSLKQKLHKTIYQNRKQRVMQAIKANPHSMEQVVAYAKRKYGYTELCKDSSKYQTEYKELRASYIQQYEPKLLGDLAEWPVLEAHTQEALEAFLKQIELRQKAAEEVPAEIFDISLHILTKEENGLQSTITLEEKYGSISGSASGNKRQMKKFDEEYREIYLYYGVSQQDIDKKTKRYEELVTALAQK